MSRGINVQIGNWRATGQTVNTPQYAVDVTIEWTDETDQPQQHTETVRFPNVLANLPAAWLCEALKDLMIRALRKRLEID